jgi:rod shape-determining protein MreC
MPLGTLDRTPPPFFRQGPSALTKLVFFSALSVFLMVADKRFAFVQPLRATLATTLLPVQQALAVPLELWHGGADYLKGLTQARASEEAALKAQAALAARAAQADALALENQRLRELLALREATAQRSQPAQVLFEAADAHSRKVVIDRGLTQGIVAGSPVIDARGVLGQVTRVFPLSAEVSLLTDKDSAIPVLNARTQARSAAFGGSGGPGSGLMELRYMAGNADVQVGDLLYTSGLDAVYPPGLAVAKVMAVERRNESGFARITLSPAAPADGVRHVLVLSPVGKPVGAQGGGTAVTGSHAAAATSLPAASAESAASAASAVKPTRPAP